LHIATFTSLSFAFDPLIICLTIKATETCSPTVQYYSLVAQLSFMAVSKVVKLIGLFMREPWDLIFLPVSIVFGYFHGWIKLYALITLRMVSRVLSFLFQASSLTITRPLGVAAPTVTPTIVIV
jgi:hypothetical protein